MLQFYFTHWNPAAHTGMAGVVPPSVADYAAAALDQMPNVLVFPRGEELFHPRRPPEMAALETALRRTLLIGMAARGEFDTEACANPAAAAIA